MPFSFNGIVLHNFENGTGKLWEKEKQLETHTYKIDRDGARERSRENGNECVKENGKNYIENENCATIIWKSLWNEGKMVVSLLNSF